MRVELHYDALVAGSAAMEALAGRIETSVRQAHAASPISLLTLNGLGMKAQWLRDERGMLDQLAALALMLDTDGNGSSTVTVAAESWNVETLLSQSADQQFGPGFAAATGLEGSDLASLLTTLSSVGRELPESAIVMSPEQLRRFIIDHPQVATALQDTRPRIGDGVHGQLYSLTIPMLTAQGEEFEAQQQRMGETRDLFASLSPEDAAILAMTYPSLVGNMSGVPFANRADANTVNVVAALRNETDGLQSMREQHEHNQHDWDLFGLNNDDLEGPIADAEERLELYRSILADDRQIIYFDPADDGAIAELHGPITADTTNVGVMVPGTGSDMSNFQGNADRSLSFQNADPTDSLSMITWMGGDLPDDIIADAPSSSYSVDLAPQLAQFSHELQQEISYSGASDPQVTVAGHSYGGAVVGRAELSGLEADRVLHIASAGMGRDVWDADDLPASQADVDRYSLTAPGDIIGTIQGMQVGDLGHGADPDTFDGTTHLHSGNTVDGELNIGKDAHSTVFQVGSDAWQNMYEVFTGGTVETYRTPEYYYPPSYGEYPSQPIQTGWNDDGGTVDIE